MPRTPSTPGLGCTTCDTGSPSWARPGTGPPRCFFFDIGLNVGSSTEAFYESERVHAKGGYASTHRVNPLAIPLSASFVSCNTAPWSLVAPPKRAAEAVITCGQQAAQAARFINATLGPRLERAGLRARDCHAVGVELRPVWGTHLPALARLVQRRFGSVSLPAFHQPFAASTCDGANVAVAQSGRYDFKVVAPSTGEDRARPPTVEQRAASNATSLKHALKAHAGMKAMRAWETTTLTTLNVLRLISEAARPSDVVALKVDIEDHETLLLPCLASSRRVGALVDVLYIEEHTNGPVLAPAYAALRARGVSVETGWP